jgi:hypothetical protein
LESRIGMTRKHTALAHGLMVPGFFRLAAALSFEAFTGCMIPIA